ncbi:unnamed protein product, partial [Meganyctiphanes norvegica]
TMLIHTQSENVLVRSSFIEKDNAVGFRDTGKWWLTSTGHRSYLTSPILQDTNVIYRDLHGRNFKVATNDYWPYFDTELLEDGTIAPVAGIDRNIIYTLGQKLNFTVELVAPADGKWGGVEADGSISGLIGMVARHEARVALCEITVTGAREVVVDFTSPYIMDNTAMISPAPKEKNRAFAAFSPFTIAVWGCLALTVFCIGPIIWVMDFWRQSVVMGTDKPSMPLMQYSFNMFRNLVVQGNNIQTHLWMLRFLFFFWYLF